MEGSKRQVAYAYLSSVRDIDLEIKRKSTQHDELETCLIPSGIRYDLDKVQTTPADQLSKVASKVIDLEREIRDLKRLKAARLMEITDILSRLENKDEETVLTEFFVGRIAMREIASSVFLEKSAAYDLRRKGLEHVFPLIPESDDTEDPMADRDYILAPVGRNVHFVDATIDISDPLDLEDHFEETLLELEDVWSGAIKLEITSMDDIYLLAENQYLLERPVCLAAENPELFEKALRVFNGIALYDGTWELDEEHLERFYRRYGLVSL